MAVESNLNDFSSPDFLPNLVTLDDMVAETVDLLTLPEKETLDEVFRGVISIPYLQESMKALARTPEEFFGF